MNGYRFWRIFNLATQYFTIAEIELRESFNGPNMAVGGTAMASSIYQGTALPEFAVDGNPNTEWISNANGSSNWWGYDFGEGVKRDIKYMAFTQRKSNANWSPRSWRVEVSDDGEEWIWRASGTGTFAAGVTEIARVSQFEPHERKMRVVDFSALRNKGLQLYPGIPGQPIFDPALEKWRPRPALQHWAPMDFGGLFKLDGSTTSLGEPVSRRVRLYHQFSGRFIAEQVTRDDGVFSFTHIEEGPWTVVGVDDTGVQNGVIYSHVKAVPMF